MEAYSKYFYSVRKSPKFYIGDRVSGKWNSIPFVGTVLLDHIISEDNEPRVHLFLDLPILHDGKYYAIITTDQASINLLTNF